MNLLCYLGTAALNLVWPYLSGTILYDKVLARDEGFLALLHIPAGRFLTALTVLVFAMIITKVAIQSLGILQGVLTAKIAPEVVAKLKSQVFASMGRLSISFYSRRQTGGLMTRISDDADEISSFFIDGIPYFFINVGTILTTCIIMLMLKSPAGSGIHSAHAGAGSDQLSDDAPPVALLRQKAPCQPPPEGADE